MTIDKTRLIITAFASVFLFASVGAITSSILVAALLAGSVIVLFQVQGLLSERAKQQRAKDREVRRSAVRAATSGERS